MARGAGEMPGGREADETEELCIVYEAEVAWRLEKQVWDQKAKCHSPFFISTVMEVSSLPSSGRA